MDKDFDLFKKRLTIHLAVIAIATCIGYFFIFASFRIGGADFHIARFHASAGIVLLVIGGGVTLGLGSRILQRLICGEDMNKEKTISELYDLIFCSFYIPVGVILCWLAIDAYIDNLV